MSFVYVVEDGSKMSIDGGCLKITYKSGEVSKMPKETVEAISIFGNSQMSTQCTKFCLEKGIRVSYFSKNGSYFGCLLSTGHVNIKRLKKQIFLSEDKDFCVKLSKKIIQAKINNQLVVVKRYLRNSNIDESDNLFQISNARKKVIEAESVEQIMGYEGTASRYYFKILSDLVETDFKFSGRNRRPPKDPFNSLLSLGYTLVMYELYGELESHGLNPFAGFLHQDRENHPTLASDMMEEWRAMLVDSVVMSLIQGHEISIDEFYYDEETGACLLKKDGMKIFLSKMEKKLHSEAKYLSYINERMSFRKAIWHQVRMLSRTVDLGDVEQYKPITIR